MTNACNRGPEAKCTGYRFVSATGIRAEIYEIRGWSISLPYIESLRTPYSEHIASERTADQIRPQNMHKSVFDRLPHHAHTIPDENH